MTELEYFVEGEFIRDRPYEKNSQELISKAIESAKGIPPAFEREEISIGWMFNSLLHYRIGIDGFTHRAGGFQEGFEIGRHYAGVLQTKISVILKENIGEIDRTLCLIIDPLERDIAKEDLVSKYNYPDVDLNAIDMDYYSDNY